MFHDVVRFSSKARVEVWRLGVKHLTEHQPRYGAAHVQFGAEIVQLGANYRS